MLNFFILTNLIILCPLIIYGIIISFINKKTSNNLHTQSKWWIYTLFGFIGTPIHELSHLIFNLIFFHKVKEVALYRPIKSKKDGVLGYVNFTYKESSLYQNIGLFFTGIGPMIGGCTVLFLLMKFLLPNIFNSFEFTRINNLGLQGILMSCKDNILVNLELIFTKYDSIQNLIIYLALAFAISTHMHISPPDLKIAVKGWIIIEILLVLISIVLGYFELTNFTNAVILVSSYMISFFTMGFIFSVLSLGISYLISLIPE